MHIKKHIPNFLTCCNLLCGCLGIILSFSYSEFDFTSEVVKNLKLASYLIFAACIFDFLDGFVARLLKVTSPIGKELDSLADCVTFGVLPGIIVFKLIEVSNYTPSNLYPNDWVIHLKWVALIIPVFSALRLAKFNIDTRQSESFIGVPTPANAILIASLPFIFTDFTFLVKNSYLLVILSICMSALLVAEIPLFALKFKNFTWNNNKIRFSFLIASFLLLLLFKIAAIPLIILLYIGLSFINKVISR